MRSFALIVEQAEHAYLALGCFPRRRALIVGLRPRRDVTLTFVMM